MPIQAKETSAIMHLNEARGIWELTDTFIKTTPISRKRLFSLVVEFTTSLFFSLTPEEEADILAWNSQSIKLAVEERFFMRGFTWETMERWATDCYRISSMSDININPALAIRTLLADQKIPVHYDFSTGEERSHPISVGLLCRRVLRNGEESVTLTAYGTLEDLAQKIAQTDHMLKTAGIR